MKRKRFAPAKTRVEISAGESVRVLRKLQELSQADLACEILLGKTCP